MSEAHSIEEKYNYPIRSVRLSHSTIQLFRSCARKFEFRKLFLHQGREDALAASVGNAMHVAWYSWLQHQDEDRAIFELGCAYPWHLNTDDNNDRSIHACISTLQALIRSGSLNDWEIATIKDPRTGGDIPAIEIPFEFRIKNITLDRGGKIPFTYVGKIDAILRNKITSAYGVSDLKTHRNKVKDLTPIYAFDDQCVPYGLVLEYILGGDIAGFDVTYASAYIDILNPRVIPYTFPKSPQDVEDWAQGLRVDLMLMQSYYEHQWFRRDASACMSFNRKCYFFDWCQEREPEMVQRLIAQGEELDKLVQDEEERFGKPLVSVELDLGA